MPLQKGRDVFRQGHRAPEGTALIKDAEAPSDLVPLLGICGPEAHIPVQDPPLGRFLQTHEMPEEGALAAPAPPHDHEDIPPVYRKGEVVLQHEAAVRHGEVLDDDMRLSHFGPRCRRGTGRVLRGNLLPFRRLA